MLKLTQPEISKKDMDELGLFASILGHIGDGNFHESIMYDRTNPEEKKRVEDCVYRMVDRALAMEGTCTVRIGMKAFRTATNQHCRENTASVLVRRRLWSRSWESTPSM